MGALQQAIFITWPGQWKFERRIPGHGQVFGQAQFNRLGANELHYQEQGVFTHAATQQCYQTTRDYYYCYCERTGAIYIYLRPEQTQLLHTLQFKQTAEALATACGTHQCGSDFYRADYKFLTLTNFEIVYQVCGPRKNYAMSTQFFKQEIDTDDKIYL